MPGRGLGGTRAAGFLRGLPRPWRAGAVRPAGAGRPRSGARWRGPGGGPELARSRPEPCGWPSPVCRLLGPGSTGCCPGCRRRSGVAGGRAASGRPGPEAAIAVAVRRWRLAAAAPVLVAVDDASIRRPVRGQLRAAAWTPSRLAARRCGRAGGKAAAAGAEPGGCPRAYPAGGLSPRRAAGCCRLGARSRTRRWPDRAVGREPVHRAGNRPGPGAGADPAEGDLPIPTRWRLVAPGW
jgi:hypothetical protein